MSRQKRSDYERKQSLSRKCRRTRVNTRRSRIRRRRCRCHYCSAAAVTSPLHNPYTKCVSVYSARKNDKFIFASYCTLITGRNGCPVRYLTYCWRCYVSMNTSTPVHIPYTSMTTNYVTAQTRSHVFIIFLIHSYLWNQIMHWTPCVDPRIYKKGNVIFGFVFKSRQMLLVDNKYADCVNLLGKEDVILN
jgi:hypothetical protein